MTKYYYAKIENGSVKLPEELLDKIGVENGNIIEIKQTDIFDIQLSFAEAWDCPYGYTETKEKCYKCHYYENCKRTERVQKIENELKE